MKRNEMAGMILIGHCLDTACHMASRPRPALGDRFRQQAKNFKHQGCPDQGGVAGLIKRRGDLHHVAADQVKAAWSVSRQTVSQMTMAWCSTPPISGSIKIMSAMTRPRSAYCPACRSRPILLPERNPCCAICSNRSTPPSAAPLASVRAARRYISAAASSACQSTAALPSGLIG